MKKILVLVIITVSFLALFLYADYHYYYQPKPAVTPMVTQKVYNDAVSTLKFHDTVNDGIIANDKVAINDLKNKQTTLCGVLTAKKVTFDVALCK